MRRISASASRPVRLDRLDCGRGRVGVDAHDAPCGGRLDGHDAHAVRDHVVQLTCQAGALLLGRAARFSPSRRSSSTPLLAERDAGGLRLAKPVGEQPDRRWRSAK